MSFERQIMSKDKFRAYFQSQTEAIVYIILQIFFVTRAVSKIGGYSRIFPSFSWGTLGHLRRLDKSRASKNIFILR